MASGFSILELADVFRARIVDVAPDSLTLEITGAEIKVNGLMDVLRPYGLLEVVRTGMVAMKRGKGFSSETAAKTNGSTKTASDDSVSYSV